MNDQSSRRTVLGITSGAIATGLAGCLTGNDQQENNGSHDSDTADQNDEEDGHGDAAHSHGSPDEALDGPSAEAEVAMTATESGDHFEPHVVWVEKGGSVNWTNESGSHSTTAYHPKHDEPQLVPDEAAAWDSGVLSEQEATFDRAFETEGVHHYYCTPHETGGMIGSVIVGHPDPATQPALEEPSSEKSEAVREKLTGLNETVKDALNDDTVDDDGQTDDDGHDDHDH